MQVRTLEILREKTDSELVSVLLNIISSNEVVEASFLDYFANVSVEFKCYHGDRFITFSMRKEHLNLFIEEISTFGLNKVGFIKRVRELTGLALLEAKLFADHKDGIAKFTSGSRIGWLIQD